MKNTIAVAMILLASSTARAEWTDDLKSMLEHSKSDTIDSFKISHCGRASIGDFSLMVRQVWKGSKLRVTKPNPEAGIHSHRVVIKYRGEMFLRNVTLTCHHGEAK